ncbi:right-handed parallel beta-helix repeat-containing protein [Microbacterium gilvum]|uniref:Right-handed parallel beta-helix repeat-containing protein n=1 Tax=Microbacterium gilvum TaxID=1336204 RepID=A0ABP8ZZ09_9MICO
MTLLGSRPVALGAALALVAACAAPAAAHAHRPAQAAAAGAVYFISPTGDDAAAGTKSSPWASIERAQEAVGPGDTVYLRGGTYAYDDALRDCSSQTDRVEVVALAVDGTDDHPITYAAYQDETPVLDFSGVLDDCRIKGISITADWLVIEGLEVTGVRQNNSLNNESWGIWISGSHNLVDEVDTHHHMGPGLFISAGGGNTVRDTDSHDNYDPFSKSGAGQNADGFGMHTAADGLAQTVFEGCRAWSNSDDGWDLINAASPVLIDRSWAWLSGYLPDGSHEPAPAGNGNGFKAGGYGGEWEEPSAVHTVQRSVAFGNRNAGFYANHHTVANVFVNNTAFDNRQDYNMLGVAPDGTDIGIGQLRNNVSYSAGGNRWLDGTDSASNTWDLGIALTDADFLSVSATGWDAPRKPDGSLPALTHLRPSADGALIDAGVDVGLPYTGAAPDLGAFESEG